MLAVMAPENPTFRLSSKGLSRSELNPTKSGLYSFRMFGRVVTKSTVFNPPEGEHDGKLYIVKRNQHESTYEILSMITSTEG
jgi:hypothetical protein